MSLMVAKKIQQTLISPFLTKLKQLEENVQNSKVGSQPFSSFLFSKKKKKKMLASFHQSLMSTFLQLFCAHILLISVYLKLHYPNASFSLKNNLIVSQIYPCCYTQLHATNPWSELLWVGYMNPFCHIAPLRSPTK